MPDSHPITPTALASVDPSAARRINRRAHTDVNACLQCLACTGGCPFADAMDIRPNQVIRHLQLGLIDELLSCGTIWICVGCHTCSSHCPMAIDMAAVMDALRQEALAAGVAVAEPDVLHFHRSMLNAIRHHGRANKLEIMMRFKFKTRRWLEDAGLGFQLIAMGKLHFRPTRVLAINEVRRLFLHEDRL